jgi:hypothetical protein
MSKNSEAVSKTRIIKRLMFLKVIYKALDGIALTFTHKTSKRRDAVEIARKSIKALEREIRRDM